MTAKKLTVIYFTVVPLAGAGNGGNICCRNHVARLNQDPNIELHVVAAPIPADVEGTQKFLDDLGGDHMVIPRRMSNLHQEKLTFRGAVDFAITAATHFPWEFEALNQPHYDEALQWAMRHWGADLIVIDYLFSALFCPQTLNSTIKTVIITLNREEEFYRDMLRLNLIQHDRFTGMISAARLRRFERWVLKTANKVVAIGSNDLPEYVDSDRKAVVVPYLDQRKGWRYSDSRTVFFVGNIGHYPNREGIEFIATKLAPRFEQTRPDIIFKIIGASRDGVPEEWQHKQVEYLGFSDAATVDDLFTSCDLMISPIKNTYGVKFKMAEALAHGTPLVSSTESLQCLPFLKSAPHFSFGDPERAADIIGRLVGDREKLEALSASMRSDADAFVQTQSNIWSETLSTIEK